MFFAFFALFSFSVAVTTPALAQEAAPAIQEVAPNGQPTSTVTPIEEFTRGGPQDGVQVLAPQAEAPQKPKDPCEAYAANYNAYQACHDRVNKIDRMKQARERRNAKPVPKTAPAAEAAAPAQADPATPAAPKAESGKK